MLIREDDLTGEEIARLLQEHLGRMHEITPPESVHALGLDALRAADITFWSAWEGESLLGCGALRELDARNGEIKSMRTADPHRRRGVGAAILEHIIGEAERRGYQTLSLETGSSAEFAPARGLYRSYGFEPCGPFAGYAGDPNSAFMTKQLPGPRLG